MRYSPVRPRLSLLAALCLGLFTTPEALPTDKWLLCGDVGRAPPHPDIGPVQSDMLNILSDQSDMIMGGPTRFQGEVQVEYQGRWLTADTVLYNPGRETVDTMGPTRFWDDALYLSGSRAHYELPTKLGWFDDAHFRLIDEHGRGNAQVIAFGETQLLAQNATYTTCNPDAVDWFIRAQSVKLDRETEVGTAKHARLHFKGVPVAYSPRLSFPLSDKRKTGFLPPAFGSSGERGAEVYLPFYWNIAPQMDATFGVRAMEDRGLMPTGEFRYLMRSGRGLLQGEYLPDDMDANKDRYLLVVQHQQQLGPAWSFDLDAADTSDKRYFEELGTNLAVSATRFLPRRANLRYQARNWSARARLETFRIVDDTISKEEEPYERLPQLLVETAFPERTLRLSPQVRGEVVRFDRDEDLTGSRFDIRPSLSFPLRTPGAFLIPRASLNYTAYELSERGVDGDDTPERTVPTFSADSGLIFERDWQFKNRPFLQTLEPRLFYLYVPRNNQFDQPVFDTDLYTFGFAQLFRENRFSGTDRVGDANQLSVALTTRLLDPGTGTEPFRASIGQIYYFQNRDVTLPDQDRGTDASSDIVAELSGELPNGWRAYGELEWDTQESQTNRGTVLLRYQPDAKRVLNLSYRFVRSPDDVEVSSVQQGDVSLRWPLTAQWSVVGRWNHDIPDSELLEAFAGFEYNSCCWGLRAVARRFLNDSNGNHTNQFFVQLEFKGLGGFGGKTVDFLEEQIPGYENEF